MNATATAILSNPEPCGHIVYPYTDDAQLAGAVSLFAGSGIRKGEGVLLIMTDAHRGPIFDRLGQDGLDVNALLASSQLRCEDAAAMVSSFMFEGNVDEHLFKTKIGAMIESAKADGGGRNVRVFGEMVSLIRKSRPQSTERMEELWNEIIQQHSVPLLCAYALSGPEPDQLSASLVACHSHAVLENLPAPRFRTRSLQ